MSFANKIFLLTLGSYWFFLLTPISTVAAGLNTFEAFTDKTYTNSNNIPVGYRLYSPTGNFDPSLPTVIYVPGGPEPVSQVASPLDQFPKGTQVLVVDTIGTSRSPQNFPNLKETSLEKMSRLFSSDQQAEAIASIVKKEKLTNTAFWSESNGVQVTLRTIDKLQRDPAVKDKPKSAFLDSGTGRQVGTDDMASNNARCHPEFLQPRNTANPIATAATPESASSTEDNHVISTFLSECKLKMDSSTADVVQFLKHMAPSLQRAGIYSSSTLHQLIGCPPTQKIKYADWGWAMTCGMFKKEALKQQCLQDCRDKACESHCYEYPSCQDKALDAKTYSMGDTNIFGLQANDDCTNWPSTMEYLMNHLCKDGDRVCTKASSVYMNIDRGGHVAYQSPGFATCRARDDARGQILSDLFKGDLDKVKNDLYLCTQGKIPEANDKAGGSTN